jgi:phosphate acetyltransferase
MAATILEEIRSKARLSRRQADDRARIALGDSTDERMLQAARIATDEQIASMILIGDPTAIEQGAKRAGIALNGIEIVSQANCPAFSQLAAFYFERRKEKVQSKDEAAMELRSSDLLFGATLVASGYADGMVAGSLSPTSDVIRAALKGIGLAENVSVLSSLFLIAFPAIPGMRDHEFTLAFADAAVVPEPTAIQLADIAIETARTYETLTGNEARVAMLSFSTKGSAHSESTEKMIEATLLARAKVPSLNIDGELQFDAAFVPDVAERKAKDSNVAGRANVFIFPNLDAGNIGYKIAERLGMGEAIGPILQGLRRPMNDLSRGASVSDIVNMIAITVLQGANQ